MTQEDKDQIDNGKINNNFNISMEMMKLKTVFFLIQMR